MGSKIVWIALCTFVWPHIVASQNYTPQDSLNPFLYNYAFENILPRPRTGRLYNVSPPVNFSGIEISAVRLRAHSLWRDGLNLSLFRIPPRTLPRPFTTRVDFVYQNLANWSTLYYNVPNYTFVTSVVGFSAYDSSIVSVENGPVELDPRGDDPIIVRFQNLSLDGNANMRCVRFGTNGTYEFTDLTLGSACVARGQGHFSVVVPRNWEGKRVFRWWMVVGGFGGLVLVVLGVFWGLKVWQWQKARKMKRESERREWLETLWIGNSKMPSASSIRTQPSLESNYVP